MNIFEELEENYTYNGEISVKAVEDDMALIVSQLEAYELALQDTRLREKARASLGKKVRDLKLNLSLLKAFKKRISAAPAKNDAITGMILESARGAKEVESPGTAAEGKEPHVQDFEKSEVEDAYEAVEDTDAVISEEERAEDVITEKDEAVEVKTGDLAYEEVSEDSRAVEEEKSDVGPELNTNVTQAEAIESESDKKIYSISINDETGNVIIEQYSTPSHADYFIPKKEEEADNITYPAEPMDNMAETVPASKAIELLKGDADAADIGNVEKEEYDEHEYPPPPTIDDYLEPVDIQTGEPAYFDEEDSVDTVCAEPEDVSDNRDCVVVRDVAASQNDVVIENKVDSDDFCFPVYNAFEREIEDEIYSSFDLSPYTNMVNTNTVTGVFDNDRKILEVTFFNTRDYSVFVELLKKKKPRLLSFLEKPKSIFMDVHERHGDEEIIYHYEFAGCRLKKLIDTRYPPKDEHGVLNTVSHECTAVFKYKKLKLT